MPSKKLSSSCHDLVRPHHLVILMLQNVTVPNIQQFLSESNWGSTGQIETLYNPSDVARI